MFTFGRDHEVKHVIKRFGEGEKSVLLVAVVNAVHDLIEERISVDRATEVTVNAFVDGKSGTWEKSGGWLLKINAHYPSSVNAWRELAVHPNATVRFRVAAFLIDFPSELRGELYEILKADKSKKVRDHAEGKWDYCVHPEKYA